MKNAKELIEEEERDRKKAEKRRAKKKVWFSLDTLLPRNYWYPHGRSVFLLIFCQCKTKLEEMISKNYVWLNNSINILSVHCQTEQWRE